MRRTEKDLQEAFERIEKLKEAVKIVGEQVEIREREHRALEERVGRMEVATSADQIRPREHLRWHGEKVEEDEPKPAYSEERLAAVEQIVRETYTPKAGSQLPSPAVEAFAGEVYAIVADALGWTREYRLDDPQPPQTAHRALVAVRELVVAYEKQREKINQLQSDLGMTRKVLPDVLQAHLGGEAPTTDRPTKPGAYIAQPLGVAPQAIEVQRMMEKLPRAEGEILRTTEAVYFRRAGEKHWLSMDAFPTGTLFLGPIVLREKP